MSRAKRWALAWFGVFGIALSSALMVTSSRAGAAKATSGHVCANESDGFVTAEGGCRDLATGLVWGTKNMGHGGAGWGWRSARRLIEDSAEGGYEDWRLPSVAEVQAVLADGAAEHFGGNHVFDADHSLWSADKTADRTLGVNSETGVARPYVEEAALYFVGVREPAPPPEP